MTKKIKRLPRITRICAEGNAAALKGKTVRLFQTNGGGGMQRCEKEFAELVPDSNVLPAKAFPDCSIRNSVPALEKFVTDRITVKE